MAAGFGWPGPCMSVLVDMRLDGGTGIYTLVWVHHGPGIVLPWHVGAFYEIANHLCRRHRLLCRPCSKPVLRVSVVPQPAQIRPGAPGPACRYPVKDATQVAPPFPTSPSTPHLRAMQPCGRSWCNKLF